MKQFRGKVAAITGAGSGIGRALAVNLAGQGMRLALSDVDAAGLTETVGLCAGMARAYVVDVRDAAAVQTWADQVVDDYGAIHLVVNNAGVSLTGNVADIGLDDLGWVMDVDFWGVVHGTKAFLPHLVTAGAGHIVNISSVFGLMAVPGQSAYNAAKFAVRGFTEALREEMLLDGHPVAVTCVHPGGIRTDIVRNSRAIGVDREELIEQFDAGLAKTTAEQAATAIVRGIRRESPRVLIGRDAYGIDLMVRLFGPAYQRLVVRSVRRRRPVPQKVARS